MTCTNILTTNLTGTFIQNTNLFTTNITGTTITSTNISTTNLTGTNINNINLFTTNITGTNLTCTNILAVNLTGTNFNITNFIATNLNVLNVLTGTNIDATNLKASLISGTSILATNITATNNIQANQNALTHTINTSTFNAESVLMSGSILESYHYFTASVATQINLQGNGQDSFHYHFSGSAGCSIVLPPANAVAFTPFINNSNKAYQFVMSCDQFSPGTLAVNSFTGSDRLYLGSSPVTTFNVAPGQAAIVTSDNSHSWFRMFLS